MKKPFHSTRGRTLRLCAASCLAFALAVAPLPVTSPGSAPEAHAAGSSHISLPASAAHRAERIKIGLDKAVVIDLPADAHDVLVANPKIADAVVRTTRRLYVFGKEVGQSNIFVFGRNGAQIASIDLVIERDIAGLESTIERLVPGSDIQAEIINDNLVLTGRVSTPQDASRAVEIADIFLKGGENTQARQSGLALIFGDERESQVVNLIKIDGDDQVHLKVTVAEIQRSVLKQLGVRTSVSRDAGAGGLNGTALSTSPFSFSPIGPTNTAVANIASGMLDWAAEFRAMEQTGVMRTMAEPSLTAVSGEQASFKVGGTIQVLESIETEEGAVTAEFADKAYGIAMNFTPTVLTGGRINLKVRTEVTEPTAANAVVVPGRTVPANKIGMRQRLADTTVELPSGGSMVIAGLVQDDIRQNIAGLPGASKIPFFGALFRSREYVRNETELVIIVQPLLVRPTAAKALARPDDKFEPANDGPGYFLGRVNRVFGVKKGKLPPGRYTGTVGFIYE